MFKRSDFRNRCVQPTHRDAIDNRRAPKRGALKIAGEEPVQQPARPIPESIRLARAARGQALLDMAPKPASGTARSARGSPSLAEDKLSLNKGRRIWRPLFYAPDRRTHCWSLSNLPPPDWTDVTVRACMHTKPGNAAAHTRTGFQACLSANAGIPPAPLLEAHHGER